MSKARQLEYGYEKQVGTRTFEFWLTAEGLCIRETDSVRKNVNHQATTLSYEDAVAKAEHQLTMF